MLPIMTPVLPQFRRNKINMTGVVAVILAVTAGVVTLRETFGINKSGYVAVYSSGPNGRRAFLWVRSAGVRNLGVLLGGNYSTASDINDFDGVAGTSGSAAGDRAVLWTKTGDVRDLGTLP